MRDIIADILNEKFPMETGSVTFSCPEIAITVKSGKTADGTFTIRAREDIPMECYLFSSDIRMRCDIEYFEEHEREIYYRFDAKGMEAGETAQGAFKLISSQGEYCLPYTAAVESDIADSSVGEIKNMFQFANLAKTNWEEAVQMFYTPQFQNTFLGSEKRYFSLYQGLSCLPKNGQNVEEFLIAANKKQRVEYTLKESRIQLYDPEGIVSEEIEITRSGWGYTALTLQAEDGFLSLEKTALSDDDFLGNLCKTVFYVDSSKLHAGRNMSAIQIKSPYHTLQVLVTVIRTPKKRFAIGIRREQKQLTYDLMCLYLNFRMKKITASVWMKQTADVIDRLNSMDERDAAGRLFQAQLLLTKERYAEAKWVLEKAQELIAGSERERELTCYYLYLTTLCSREPVYVDEVTQKVQKAYRANPSNFRIAWLLLYLDVDYNKSPARKWTFMEDQFGRGSRSPLLYVEALALLNANPAFLMQLSDYTISLLRFGFRYDALSEEVIRQICYLADKRKEFQEAVYTLLTECYRLYPEDETLQSVCVMLVKGNKLGEQYAPWYEKAVEAELRITRLYEHYIMSLPLEYEGKLPKMVLMYFAYNNNLGYERKAFLYAYILKNNEDYPDLYRTYVPEIERFAVEQMQKGRINKDLAYLYKKILTSQMIQSSHTAMLADILFTELIESAYPDMTHVIVVYDKLKMPYIYPLMGGKAYVPLYGGDYTVLLEDKRGNRYAKSIPYMQEKLLWPGKLAKQAAPFTGAHVGLDMYLCESGRNYIAVTEDNVEYVQHLMDSEEIRDTYKDEIAMKLTEFYYENDMIRDLDRHLAILKPDRLSTQERGTVIRYLTVRGMYDKALAWIKEYGTGGIEPRTIVRLCRRLLEREPDFYDGDLTAIMHYAFEQGKYDEAMLEYLSRYYKGLTEEMRDLWNACVSYEADAYVLSEKILTQMLFTGAQIDEKAQIFSAYVHGGAKTEVEHAVLSQASFDYFVKGVPQEDVFFAELVRVFGQGERLNVVSRLAFLKYFASRGERIAEELKPFMEQFIEELLRDGVCFPFYRFYAERIPALSRIADRTYIEYKAAPGTKVMLHYAVKQEAEDEEGYRTEQMRNMYGGIFVKDMVLFYGEYLQYYITEESAQETCLTERGGYQSEEDSIAESGRFAYINDIAMAGTMQDYHTVNTMLQEYFELDRKVKALFSPLST